MTASTKSHGMDGTLVEPDWPPLTLADLRILFAEVPSLGEPARIETASPRPFSAAGVVATTTGRVFVQRHSRELRNREGLLEEHRFLAHLHAHGAAVPRVIPAPAGDTAIELGDSTYEVHEIPAGIDLYEEAQSWTPFQSTAHARS